MARRTIFEIDVTYEDNSSWSQVATKDLLKLFADKGIKNISIKKVNKRKLEGK